MWLTLLERNEWESRILALILKDINAGYNGKIQLRDVSLDIDDRDFVGIVGPNGGGKTTLLRVILGLLKPYSGTVRYLRGGSPVDSLSVGYLPQTRDIDTDFPISVAEVVASGMNSPHRLFGGYTREQRERARETMDAIGITDMARRPIKALSGGELQRVLFARALVSRPEVLVLDEPDNFVDDNFETFMYDTIRRVNREAAVVMVSHDRQFVETYAKKIIEVNERVKILR